MRTYKLLTMCVLAMLPVSASELGIAPAHYIIGAGDVLSIDVWKEPAASVQTAAVRPDGMISVPIVKDVQAAGLTPAELQFDLAGRFSKYLKGADVSVIVKEIHSQKIYVIGAVKKEGSIDMKAPLTVLQAVAEAGGLNDYARRRKIYILRQLNGKEARLPFDYSAVIRGAHPEQNITLQVGDTVVVPPAR